MTTRRKFGLGGIAAMLAAQRAPAALVRSLVAGRHIAATGTRLPYDAEVEYLESTGTQWIDTGVAGVGGLHITCSFMPLYPVATANQDYFGGSDGDNAKGYRVRNGSSSENVLSVSIGSKSNWSFSITGGLTNVEVTSTQCIVNGTVAVSTIGSDYPGQSLYIFGHNRGGTAYRLSKMRLYRFAIEGKTDLNPVRFTNELGQSEGAMFDLVKGQLFRNAGTGSFIIGPAKARGASGQNGGGYKWIIIASDSGPSWRPHLQRWRQLPSSWKEAA